jgi:hypothetical protein
MNEVCQEILPDPRSNDNINSCKPTIAKLIFDTDIQQSQLCNSITSPIDAMALNLVDSTLIEVKVNTQHDETFYNQERERKNYMVKS